MVPPSSHQPDPHVQGTLNTLIQLQDLVLARDERKAAGPGKRLAELNRSIEAMLDELAADRRTHIRQLLRRSPLAVVPIHHRTCTGCGMALPVSLVNNVHAARAIYRCPSCTRILYYRESEIRRRPERRRRRANDRKGLERFSCEALMIPRLGGGTPEEVLGQMCRCMEEQGFIENSDALLEQAMQREAISTTAMEHGIAFPHVRGVEGGGLTLAAGVHRKGIHFDPDSRRLSRIFLFMTIPTAASAFYLRLVSGLSESLSRKEVREEVLGAETPQELWKRLQKATRKTVR
ncbi:PTS sugar transporter subunit IIA [Kiritimatiella glycovorans]|uniref:EIIBCA-Man n=1 Tax=Kiritimatiella glycovorans TaxID=1307763 RepID=A0A0G3EGT4_9BACT|nr:PTS sugar transporter subunit IIA [Kiritimatiella glycovorans]AKJ64632.1 EIIBCA-Man [Kiritimatiella glycovorans]